MTWTTRVDEETGKVVPNPWRVPPDIEDLAPFDDCEGYIAAITAQIRASGRVDALHEDTITECDEIRARALDYRERKGQTKRKKREDVRNVLKSDGRAVNSFAGKVWMFNNGERERVDLIDVPKRKAQGWIVGMGRVKESKNSC